jgi:cytoskeletal protein RodZ
LSYDCLHLDAGLSRRSARPESAVSSFGENLRRRRELRGISLDAISNSTKISPRMLRAIEDEHFDQLPGGVFNKGFVRAYARQIGLDEEEAVTDYLAALRESQVQAQTILPNFRAPGVSSPAADHDPFPSTPSPIHRPNGGPAAQASSPVAPPASPEARRSTEERRKESRRAADRHNTDPQSTVLQNPDRQNNIEDRLNNSDDRQRDRSPSQDLYTSNHFVEEEDSDIAPMSFLNLNSPPPSAHSPSHDHRERHAAPTPISARTTRRLPWEAIAAALLVVTLVFAFWTFHNRNRSAATQTPVISEPSSTAALPAPSLPAASVPAPSVPATTEARTPPKPHDSAPRPSAPHPAPAVVASDVTTSTPKPHPQPADKKPAPVPTFRVVIRADQTSWVSITADGQPIARETLIAPANTAVRASREIIVKAGNSAGISFLFNGKEVPSSGSSGDVRTYVFDSNGLRTSAPASNPTP